MVNWQRHGAYVATRMPVILRTARQEFALLLSILVVAVAIAGFSGIAEEVLEGETSAFDEAVLLALRDPADLSDPIGPAWLERVAQDVTALGGYTCLALLIVLVVGYQFAAGHRRAALLVAVSVGGGMLISHSLKAVFARPRPDLVPHIVEVQSLSFPSGHAMLSTVTYLTLGALLLRMQPGRGPRLYLMAAAMALALLIGCSRVYLGVHYPTDVAAGWCVGAAWAMFCWGVALWLQRHGGLSSEAEPAASSDSG